MTDAQRLRKAINDCCRVQRYTDQQLAKASGLSREVVYKIRTGRNENPNLKTIGKLAKVFGYDTAT